MLRTPNQAGLTRKEIVCFAALLLIVVAVAVPWFQHQARASARTASLQNLRQWGIALNLYLLENDHALPAAATNTADPNAWFNALPPYLSLPPLQETSLSQIGPGTLWTDPAARLPASGTPSTLTTYGMNAWLQPDPNAPAWRIYDIEDPSSTLFLIETEPGRLRAQPADTAFRHGRPAPHPEACAHALFCDGHVEAIGPSDATPAAANPQAHPAPRPNWVPFYQAPAPR
jgi:prepilin-type processing-associated H-X9-DG protein